MTRDQLRELMHTTADQIGGVVYDAAGHNDDYGFGRVNASAAVRAAARRVTLMTSPVDFNDVPEGETTARSITWDVEGIEDFTFEVTAARPRRPARRTRSSCCSALRHGPVARGRGHRPGPDLADLHRHGRRRHGDRHVEVRSVETGETWTVPPSANTIERPTAAVVMVLDKSGSMDVDAGDGRPRVEVLRESAQDPRRRAAPETGIGVVRFDHDASPRACR